jgi:hypothetical protein
MCHGQLQASCGALTCLSDCNCYIGTGGMTEVAHCRLSSYHNLQVCHSFLEAPEPL